MLIILSGLPGTGKTTLARELAKQLGAVHLRIDTIEQALREAGLAVVADEGYRVACAVAEDNLRLGRTVVADSVNPLAVTRQAWHAAAERAGTRFVNVECVCSDTAEHRHRVETRQADIAGFKLPTWNDVLAREYHDWDAFRIVVDTATESAIDAAARLAKTLA